MAEFRGGIKGAAEMLAGLDLKSRHRVLEEIRAKDPEMAKTLEENLVTFEDLLNLNTSEIITLLKEIDISDLGLSLRIASKEVKSFVLASVSKGIKSEIEDILLGPPQSVEKIEAARQKIILAMKEQVDKGQIVLDKEEDELV